MKVPLFLFHLIDTFYIEVSLFNIYIISKKKINFGLLANMCTFTKQKAFEMQKPFTINLLNNLNQHVQNIETVLSAVQITIVLFFITSH